MGAWRSEAGAVLSFLSYWAAHRRLSRAVLNCLVAVSSGLDTPLRGAVRHARLGEGRQARQTSCGRNGQRERPPPLLGHNQTLGGAWPFTAGGRRPPPSWHGLPFLQFGGLGSGRPAR